MSWNEFEPLPVAPMTSSMRLAWSNVLTGAVCHTVITSCTTAIDPIQLNLRGSYITWLGSVAAKIMAVESGVPMTVPSLGATLKIWFPAATPPPPGITCRTTSGSPGMCFRRCSMKVRA